jgi:hypothetical protein
VDHPISRDGLERFAAGAATRDESRQIARHLLKGCATCASTLRELDHRKEPLEAYDRALDSFERGFRSEVQASSGVLAALRV